MTVEIDIPEEKKVEEILYRVKDSKTILIKGEQTKGYPDKYKCFAYFPSTNSFLYFGDCSLTDTSLYTPLPVGTKLIITQ